MGYFSLIKNSDYFIFFDTPQYIRKGWINRNRIIGANGDAVFFTVPVKNA
ncbi:MAG: WbqC family protein [Waltera sp.]